MNVEKLTKNSYICRAMRTTVRTLAITPVTSKASKMRRASHEKTGGLSEKKSKRVRWLALLLLGLHAPARRPLISPNSRVIRPSLTRKRPPSGYMRTVLRAQKQYKKKNDKFATSLSDLVHTGSFTKRMVNPDRGDYSVGFKPNKPGQTKTDST